MGTGDAGRRLVLLRHAKSDWPDVPDRDRPLAKRGRRDAPRIGRWLREQGYQPDVVVVSAATRTRQTWDLVAPELGGSPAVHFEPRAYAASALTLLYLAQELPERYRTALLIAPTALLLLHLSDLLRGIRLHVHGQYVNPLKVSGSFHIRLGRQVADGEVH